MFMFSLSLSTRLSCSDYPRNATKQALKNLATNGVTCFKFFSFVYENIVSVVKFLKKQFYFNRGICSRCKAL